MYSRKSVCTGSAPSTWVTVSAGSRHAEVLQRIGDGAGHLSHVAGERGPAADVGIDGVGGGLALLLGEDGLLFEKRSEELVRVLQGAESEHTCGIDFVEDRNFRVEIRGSGQRILFEVADLRLDDLGVATNGADGRQRG